MTTYHAGDDFNPKDLAEGPDCPATGPGGMPFCNLAEDHAGQHVAADLDMKVVAVWG